MALLILLAFVSGAATAISPCALPVLPVVFAAGTTGGRRRPLGIALGLAVSFTFAVVVLVYVISALGLPQSFARNLAIAVLVLFGISLVWPAAAEKVEVFFSRMSNGISSRIMPQVNKRTGDGVAHDGFRSGLFVGFGLGFVYAPCAGPILAGVITATASQALTAERIIVALAYGTGSALTFLFLMLGGRKVIAPLMKRTGAVQAVMGVLMILTGVAMFANLDTRFQTAIASDLPTALVNPSHGLETKAKVRERLGESHGSQASASKGTPSGLSDHGPAPDFQGTQQWFNTANNQPLTLAQLRGKVVLVDFWTYTCINCIRTLPHIEHLYQQYQHDGLVVVGVHTPEFPFEHSASNVSSAIKQNKLTYPVAQDNDYKTWNAYDNEYWPAQYLIDAKGHERYMHIGEGGDTEIEHRVQSLLREAGMQAKAAKVAAVHTDEAPDQEVTPETYIGADRAERFANGTIMPGTHSYKSDGSKLTTSELRYSGDWKITGEDGTANGDNSQLELQFHASKVYLVLSPSETGNDKVQVSLDGKPITAKKAGADVHGGVATVDSQRLYRLVDLPSVTDGHLKLQLPHGVSGYAFTFG